MENPTLPLAEVTQPLRLTREQKAVPTQGLGRLRHTQGGTGLALRGEGHSVDPLPLAMYL